MTSLMTSQNHVAFRQVLENSKNKNKNNKAISKTALKHAVKKTSTQILGWAEIFQIGDSKNGHSATSSIWAP